jgi:hypothetical protein
VQMTALKDRMRQGRSVKCMTPAGFEVTIRPPNMEQHALSGGLPSRLREMAMKGVTAIDEAMTQAIEGDVEMLGYLDGIVAKVFVEPKFELPVYEMTVPPENPPDDWQAEIIQTSGDRLDEYLAPIDYRWALLVAFGEEDKDGEGRRLFGREPLSRFATFRAEHGCAEDCVACQRVRDLVSLGGAI